MQYFSTCSSYHLHHVAGKVVALAEFIEYGEELSKNTVEMHRHSQPLWLEGLMYWLNQEDIQHLIKC